MYCKRLLCCFLLATLLNGSVAAQETHHPLDSLSWQEYWTVLEVLQAAGHLNRDTRFQIVTLQEPGKDAVLAWSPGQAIPRAAFAIVRQQDKAFEARVDVAANRLVSWQEIVGAQSSWLGEEFGSMDEVVMANPDFIAAMKRRGIEDFSLLNCDASPPGYFATGEQQGRRIANFVCHLASAAHNTWSRSIENLTVVVDINTREVLRVVDEGVVPVPPAPAGFDVAALGAPSAGPAQPGTLQVTQPGGPGFTLNGEEVAWQNWRFHLRSDQRVGVVLSLVSWHDADEIRPVMYQGFLSEIFVPYMDPAFAWFSKNYLDLGEYSAGGLTKPLIRGVDCPDYASYQSALVTGDDGRPLNRPDMICLFEREAGDMAWRHGAQDYDRGPEGRKRRDLVVRSAAILGNYDYVFDWVFQQDGSITVAVGATGILAVKAVAQRDAADNSASAEPADAYGRFVDQNMVAVNHDHYFNFRLDMDVDGPENSLIIDRLETKLLPADHPRRSVWVSNQQLAQREADARLSMGHDSAELWMVTSSGRKNQVGYATSFQLMPGHNAGSLLTADDYPRRRAGFIEHQLWVTPYEAAERYAAGDYPTLSTPGQGLPAWTTGNRNIAKTDIVLWYTIGMHHLVRAEDWPVMPVMWSSFQLRPFNFFNHNPAMDLADSATGAH